MQEDLSAAIITSMSDGLLVVDTKGFITRSNPAALQTLGLTPAETAGRTYSQLFMDAPENDAFNDILFDGLQRREARYYGEAVFRRRDGRLIDLAVTTSFLNAGDPDGRSIVVVFKDITELKELDRARKRVLAHLSHELKTPLAIVFSSIEHLATPENTRTMDRIRRNLQRLLMIQEEVGDIVSGKPLPSSCSLAPWVEQALDLVELVAEEHPQYKAVLDLLRKKIHRDFSFEPARAAPIALATSIRRVLEALPPAARERRLRLETRAEDDFTPQVEGQVLEKVLGGLLRNAIENTPDGGCITIRIDNDGGHRRLTVLDTGVGITTASREQIFGGFYHAVDTNLYSTKKPFAFGAGGKGLDLLRARIYGEMLGFGVECRSTRCRHIPSENDLCPGDVARCPHVSSAEECAAAGGSEFSLVFDPTSDAA